MPNVGDVSLIIWNTDEGSPSEVGDIVLWRSHAVADFSARVSIPQMVEDNADQLRQSYLALIHELGEAEVKGKRIVDHLEIRPGFSFWWMTLLFEKCNFSKSPQIDNIIKLMAFRGWLTKQNYSDISLVSANAELASAVQLLALEFRVGFSWKKVAGERNLGLSARRFYGWTPEAIRALIWLSRHLIARWPLKGVGLEGWKNSRATTTFASYLFNLDPGSASQGIFESRNWGKLPEVLDKEGVETNWIHLYVASEQAPTTKAASEVISQFNQTHLGKQNHVVLDSFLDIGVMWKAIHEWYWAGRKRRQLEVGIRKKCGYLWPLLKFDFSNSMIGPAAMSNLLNIGLFEKAMCLLEIQTKALYLQENQSWEYAFIHAWRRAGHNHVLMGVPHSTVRYWDLRYHFDPRSYVASGIGRIPLPDLICINGEEAKRKLLESGCPLSMLVEVEALRYLYLADNLPSESNVNSSRRESPVLLVVGEYQRDDTTKLMELLRDTATLVERGIKYIVKPHPSCPISSEDYPEFDFEVTSDPISTVIDRCSLVYSGSFSTAAVDAYCMGKQVVTVLDPKKLNMSPLRNREGVSFVVTAEDLAAVLNGYDMSQDAEVEGADFFYLNQELARWRKLVIDEGPSPTASAP